MELYFDQDNGVLGYLTEDKNFIPVKTNAQLDPTHIYLDEDGYLYLKSYVDDTVYPLKDTEGKLISLKGEKGDKGQDGVNGKNGQNGTDGQNGKDGKDGQDGEDGITPQLKIDEGYWRISYDNGATWTQLGKATEALELDNKQDKTDTSLVTAYKTIPQAINEVLYNVWNPVLYNYIKDSGTNFSPSNIVLDENGRMKLTYKSGSGATPELPPLYIKNVNGQPVTFATLFKDYPSLNTTNKTLIGAINELASFHDLSDSYFTTYSDSSFSIAFTELALTVESSSQMYKLTGVVKSSIDNGQTNACLVAIPKDRAYYDPSFWKDVKYEYHDDIIIVEFDKTFELAEGKSINDYVLYVCFVSPSVIKSLIPSGFGEPNAWELQTHTPFTTYPVTIMVSNLQLLPVEPNTTEYLTPEIQDQVNALSEKVTQLENELSLANDTISTLLTKIEWLDQLDQEGLVKAWSKEANS